MPLDRNELFERWDAITVDQLHATGGMKWSAHPGLIGAWVAESDLGTAPEVSLALHEAVNADVFGYLPAATSAAMSRATSAWMLERFGWRAPASRVHAIGDVITGLSLAIDHYSRAGSSIVVPTPAYMPFLTVPELHDRGVIEVPLARQGGRAVLDLNAIESALAAGAGLVVLCNPLNPGGRVFDASELAALSVVVDRHGARVFADEVHAPIVFGEHRHVPYASVSAEAAAHSVTATSASKAWNLPGLKAAQFITTNESDEETWQALGPLAGHGASTLGVIANTAAYAHGGDWVDAHVEYIDESSRLFGEMLADRVPEIGYVRAEGTYIAWLDVRELSLGDDPAAAVREGAGIAFTDGRACGAAGSGHLRAILATPRPIVEEMVDRLARMLGR